MGTTKEIKPAQLKVLKELEEMIGKPIPIKRKVDGDTIGARIEDGTVTELSLFYCDLTDLPKSLGRLKSLRVLYLLWNKFERIPDVISELENLKVLDLDAIQLKSLPDSICKLKSLRTLYASNNRLKSLPACIGDLSSLRNLYLSGNQLTELPESMSKLQSLKRLFLQGNKFTTFPEVVTQIGSLQALNMVSNQLTKLPNTFWRLKNLKKLQVEDNPWDDDWESISHNTLPVIMDYCRKNDTISIFISHAWIDQDTFRVIELDQNLEGRDEIYNVYICEKDLVGDIREFMDEMVPQSQLLLFIATSNSIKSEDCLHELALALTHKIEIIPIIDPDMEWEALNQIDLTAEGKGFFDLGEKKGFKFDLNNFTSFCDDLYDYILQFKREVNLYEPEKAEIDKQLLNLKQAIINFIDSPEVRDYIVRNFAKFEELFDNLSGHEISSQEYYTKISKMLSKLK